MSGALFRPEERRPAGIANIPHVLRSLAAVALFPFDDVLRGMVGAGQGIEALCLFLQLTRSQLDDNLIRLGLPTPHDRPLRKGGRNPWSAWDKVRMMWWRTLGVHPEIIGEKLNRSAGAVRSQCRRMGLTAPPREILHKPGLDTLRDPEFGFAWREVARTASPATPQSACGTVAGVITYRSREAAKSITQDADRAIGGKATGFLGGAVGQRELPLFGVVGGTARQSLAQPASKQIEREIGKLARATPELALPKTEAEVDFSADLTWIGKIKCPLKDKLAVWVCGMLYLGGLHYTEIAKRVGKELKSFYSFRTRSGIPVDEDRRKFGDIFDEQIARATLAASGYTVRQCMTASENRDGRGNWFWVRRSDLGIRRSPPKRKRDHLVEGRFNRVTILKGRDAKRNIEEISPPFAKIERITGSTGNFWSAAHA